MALQRQLLTRLGLFAALVCSQPQPLSLSPRAASWTQNVEITLGTGGAIASGALCVFEGGASSQPCSVDTDEPSQCSCTTPISPGLLGDVKVALHTAGGQELGNSTLTYFADEQPPAVLDFAPIGADCSSGHAVVRVRGRNFAPTSGLTCSFGEAGESGANFSAASRGAEGASEAVVECAVPATADASHTG